MTDPQQLSHAQQALWFLYRLAPDAAVYNTGCALTVRSAVDLPALRAAVEALAERHDMLRSVFQEVDGQAVRLVGERHPLGLEVRELPGADPEGLAAAARAALREPFRLERDGAFRFVLLRRGEADAVLLMAGHHIGTDATSNWLIVRDLLHGYHLLTGGGDDPAANGPTTVPPPPKGSYADHVAKERTVLDSPRGARMEQYWHRVCADAAPAELPTDRPRPASSSRTGATHHLDLADGRVEALRELARSSGVSLFSVLLGTFQSLLHRRTRQNGFLIGCPTTTRMSPVVREVVGNFVNTLLFRGDFDPGTTFRQAAEAADRQVKAGLGSAGHPFELLTRTVNRPRTGAGSSLCRITFNLVGTATPEPLLRLLLDADGGRPAEFAGLTIAPFELPQAEGQLDLAVSVRQSASSLAVDFRYDVDLFDPATVERFAGHFLRAVDAALADPDAPVARLRLVDDTELAELMGFGTEPAPRRRARRG
ncbi:condensation domain-containing protein [Kitasatospora purpeofusca]|uniref:condensation domain-containing protein n=1 Tax=Kitasatospora purpeofusca TaxID=67352 RepID=UPI00225274EA|nr:condensation domain-containing protein [Kitasatospora purpeofusca]MCX4687149.1 condensation domain-containing protein [Kitasatospora purpeofusca]